MEPKFQTSFIPKKPGGVGGGLAEGSITIIPSSQSIFVTIATTLFVVFVVISGLLFGYKMLLTGEVKKLNDGILEMKSALNEEETTDLANDHERIVSAKMLLDKHVSFSQTLELLEKNIMQKIKINTFTYSTKQEGITLVLDLESQTYNALTKQSEVFMEEGNFNNQEFSGFSLLQNGHVNVRFFTNVISQLVNYKRVIESQNPTTVTDDPFNEPTE